MAGLLDARARPQQVAITGIQLALETYTNIKYIKIKMPVVESIPEEKRGVEIVKNIDSNFCLCVRHGRLPTTLPRPMMEIFL